jgi:hypothetical protein
MAMRPYILNTRVIFLIDLHYTLAGFFEVEVPSEGRL